MTLFASSSPHDEEGYFKKSFFRRFEVPTSDTRIIMRVIDDAISNLFQSGVRYYRCGVGLVDLHCEHLYQFDLFSQSSDNPKLMSCIDNINSRFGRSTVQFADKGTEQKFAMRRQFLSPQYTTRWEDVPKIIC
jgi:DNA polymerase V